MLIPANFPRGLDFVLLCELHLYLIDGSPERFDLLVSVSNQHIQPLVLLVTHRDPALVLHQFSLHVLVLPGYSGHVLLVRGLAPVDFAFETLELEFEIFILLRHNSISILQLIYFLILFPNIVLVLIYPPS